MVLDLCEGMELFKELKSEKGLFTEDEAAYLLK
jgi:hypothetical protein